MLTLEQLNKRIFGKRVHPLEPPLFYNNELGIGHKPMLGRKTEVIQIKGDNRECTNLHGQLCSFYSKRAGWKRRRLVINPEAKLALNS